LQVLDGFCQPFKSYKTRLTAVSLPLMTIIQELVCLLEMYWIGIFTIQLELSSGRIVVSGNGIYQIPDRFARHNDNWVESATPSEWSLSSLGTVLLVWHGHPDCCLGESQVSCLSFWCPGSNQGCIELLISNQQNNKLVRLSVFLPVRNQIVKSGGISGLNRISGTSLVHTWQKVITQILSCESFLWPPYEIGQAIIFLRCGFFFYVLSFLFLT